MIDRCAGTRDLRELSGLGRRVPVLAVAGTLAAASMAGIPPLLGFAAKEGGFEAFLHDSYGAWDDTLLAAAVLGSALTVAYSTRFIWARSPASSPSAPGRSRIRPGPLFVASPVLLGLACLAAGPAAALLAPLLVRYADTLAPSYPVLFDFSLLPGNALALGLSLLAVVLGVLAALPRVAARAVAARRPLAAILPRSPGGRWCTRLETGALRVTAQTQRGSLAVVVCTVLGGAPRRAGRRAGGDRGARGDPGRPRRGLPGAAGRRRPRRRVHRGRRARPPPPLRRPARRAAWATRSR